MSDIPSPSTTNPEAAAIEAWAGRVLRGRLPPRARAVAILALKQAWAALFAILFLTAIVISALFWNPGWPLARYDALVIFAVTTQALLIATRLETWEEARVIALFHVTGTVMEIFKLAQGSWDYPETGLLEIAGVPLFTGFMYASIGSYIARAIRLFGVTVAPYPPFWVTVLLACLIYGNFFAHHWLPDIRGALFAATLVLFWPSVVQYRSDSRVRRVRLPVIVTLTALAVWVAENVGTFTATWTYPGQGQFSLVSLAKFGSWYLLLWVAFVTVTLVSRDALRRTTHEPVCPTAPSGQTRQRR